MGAGGGGNLVSGYQKNNHEINRGIFPYPDPMKWISKSDPKMAIFIEQIEVFHITRLEYVHFKIKLLYTYSILYFQVKTMFDAVGKYK